MNKRQVLALYKAVKTLENKEDGLRVERATLQLQATFTESQAKKAVEYLNTVLVTA